MIRYLLQGFAMLGDILVAAAVTFLIHSYPTNPWVWALAFVVFRTWLKSGGFFAWERENIKKFLKNAKRIGW